MQLNQPSVWVGEVLLVIIAVMIPVYVHAGFLSNLFTNNVQANQPKSSPASTESIDVSLLTALQNPNPISARGGADIVVNDNVLVSTGPVGEDEIEKNQGQMGEIRVYTVRDGDSLSQVAEMFGVTTNTIMWANDISRATAIQPGDTLVILPIVGIKHEIKSGDTIGKIADKYDGNVEEILAYNELSSADELTVGEVLIIPGGELHSRSSSIATAQPIKISGSGSASVAGFTHPAPGSVKTQGIHGYNAVDLAGGHGSGIRAAASGEVIVSKSSGWNGGYGQYIVVKHPNGTQTLYAHLSSNAVGVGAYVSNGQVIGSMGSTGRSTGSHLHFEVRGARNPF